MENKSITYNAGKFYYGKDEIVNPEALPPIPMDTLLDGKAILPATLRAEVEYQCQSCDPGDCHSCVNGSQCRKVVRLMEVESESTGILAVGVPEYEPAFPEPDKQAIDDLKETFSRDEVRSLMEIARQDGYRKGKSSQPPPQAESQNKLWNEVLDECQAHYINDVRLLESLSKKFFLTRNTKP